MTRGPFHPPFAHGPKTWIARLGFIGGVAALAFAATTHYSPGVADAQTRSGETRAEEDDYALTLGWAGTYTAGKQGTVTLKLVPRGSYRVDTAFPTKFVLADPPGGDVALTKKKLEKADGTITESSAIFSVPFTATKAGRVTISGKAHFKVCTEKKAGETPTCKGHEVDMSISVDVAAAPTPTPTPTP